MPSAASKEKLEILSVAVVVVVMVVTALLLLAVDNIVEW